MTARVLNRMIAAFGITAVALTGLYVPAAAQAQQGQNEQAEEKPPPQEKEKQQQAKKKQEQDQKKRDQQQRVAQEQSAQLQRANRGAQYSFQLQYTEGLRQQRMHIQTAGGYDYGRDPYFYTAPGYRYSRGGRYDYNHYFRQGVRRDYEDGYCGRYHYGTYSNGRTSILGAVLGGILVFEALR